MTRSEIITAIRARILHHRANADHWKERVQEGWESARDLERMALSRMEEAQQILELFRKW